MTTPRQRLFTNEFQLRDVVAVIRHEHGWEDGKREGVITRIDSHSAVVKTEEGYELYIRRPRRC